MKYPIQLKLKVSALRTVRALLASTLLLIAFTALLHCTLFSSRAKAAFIHSELILAQAQTAGGVDPTFNLTGFKEITISPNTGTTTPHDQANAVVVQSDGKIVLAGYAKDGTNSTTSPPEQFALVRLNTDGSQDAGFGTLGIVTTQAGTSTLISGSRAQAVAVQTDGKIVAAGFANVDSPIPHPDFGLVRYNGNGSLDTNFGNGGKVTGTFAGALTFSASATSLLIQPDGKIVVGGVVQSLSTANDFALARYNNDGSLDSTFGNGGKVTTDFGSAAEQINGLAFQLDQNQLKIVARRSICRRTNQSSIRSRSLQR